MKLLSANIESFGKLKNAHFDFDERLTVLREANGVGKTTLCAFIRAMLYGFTYKRVNNITDAARFQPWGGNGKFGGSLTVEQDGTRYRIERFFGLTQRAEQKRFTNEDTGRETEWKKEPGEVLLGLTADSFDRSAYFPQEAVELATNDNLEERLANLVQNSAENYDKIQAKLREYKKNLRYERGTGGKISDLQMKRYDLERQLQDVERDKKRDKEIKARLLEIEKELSELSQRHDEEDERRNKLRDQLAKAEPTEEQQAARARYRETEKRVRGIPAEFDDDWKQCEDLAQKIASAPKEEVKPQRGIVKYLLFGAAIAFALAGLAGIILIVLGALQAIARTMGIVLGVVLIVVGAAICLAAVFARKKSPNNAEAVVDVSQLRQRFFEIARKYVYVEGADVEAARRALWEKHRDYEYDKRWLLENKPSEADPAAAEKLQEQLRVVEQSLKQHEEKREALHTERGRLQSERNGLKLNGVEIVDKILNIDGEISLCEYNYRVADKVFELLQKAKENLSVSYLPKLCNRTTELLRRVTSADFRVQMDRNFNISIREGEQTKPMSEFSRGIREITLLCFRLALGELLYNGTIPLLIVDDAFVNFDEKNFVRATKLLAELQDTQIIYFTCHNRTGELR